ncbi:DCN1 protein 2 [Elysia marginata]|uniref:DCN1 protein 2 n=1 Tax=Elysia marginata TaxID=1093978 RepID=A0AAV4EI07_9GAST|nr:DCN1 protein 2 [Elysia marginata]
MAGNERSTNSVSDAKENDNILSNRLSKLSDRLLPKPEEQEKGLRPGDSELQDCLSLISAARRGDVTEVESLIGKLRNGDWLRFGTSPLIAAMRAEHNTIVKTLIQLGVRVNERLYKGRTALLTAIAEGLEDFVTLLLDAGAQINLADDSGITPLMLASKKGSRNIVQLLVSHRECDIEQVDFHGKTALAYAAKSGEVEIAKILLDAGANPSSSDNKRETIFMLATRAGCLPLVDLLLRLKVEVNEQNDEGFTALMLCVGDDRGRYDVMRHQVEAGADLNLRNKWQESALMLACGAGQWMTVDFLTLHGAILNTKNIWGETPLMYAAENGHNLVVDILLKRGSHVNETDEKDETALMHAVKSLRAVPIEPPIQCIPKVNQICNNIYTCRTTKEKQGAVEVVSLLLDAGSNVRAKNYCGQTALMMAAMHGRNKLVEVILKKSETESNFPMINMTCNHKMTALTYAAVCGHPLIVTQLLKNKTFVNHMPEEICQAVNMAVICDYPEVVSILLNAKLFLGMPSKKILKLLDLSLTNACRRGNTESTKFLIEYLTLLVYGASKDILMKRYFLIPIRQGHTEVVSLFGKVYYRRSAVWAAFMLGRTECLELIHRATEHPNKHLQLWKRTNNFSTVEEQTPQDMSEIKKKNTSWSNLLDAVASGDRDKVKLLLQCDASMVNKSSATGLTALIYACLHGHMNIVAELLTHSARLDKTDINGCTPLMYAARFGHADCVQLLLRMRCNVKQTCRSFHTALTLASKVGRADIVEMLLKAGTDIPKRQNSALHFAASGSHKGTMEILIRYGFGVNHLNENGQTPLMFAAYDGSESSVAFLLEKGADHNRSDVKGRTALSFAAELGKMQVVKLLLRQGGPSSKADKYGAMPIWHAASNGYPEVVEELLEHEVSMHYGPYATRTYAVNNVCKTDGSTPLMHMCQHGFYHTVKFLCGKGAYIDAVNNLGQTALHVAAMHDRLEVCNELLDYGARTDVVDKQGNTPLRLALSRGHLKLVSILENMTIDTPNGCSGLERQVEYSTGNSAPGRFWVSFKSRVRMSFRRRHTRRHNELYSNSVVDAIARADEKDKEHTGKSSTFIQGVTTESTGVQNHINLDRCEVTDSESSVVNFSLTEDGVCSPPSLLDPDLDVDPFECDSSSSIRSLNSLLKDCRDVKNMLSTHSDILVLFDKETDNVKSEATSPSTEAHLTVDKGPVSDHLRLPQRTCQKSVQKPLMNEAHTQFLKEENGQQEQQKSHEYLQQEKLQENKLHPSERLHETKSKDNLVPDVPKNDIQHGINPNRSVPTLTDTGNKAPTQNPDDPVLAIESMAKTTIHAAVSKCLQQLPPGITQDLTRSATSCNTSASAMIQTNPCSCGGHGLTLQLNQVFHIKSHVKKKKCFRANALRVSRAKYLATGTNSKIMFRRVVRPPQAASANNDDCGGDDDDDDDDEISDEYETDSDSDTSEVEEGQGNTDRNLK